MANKKKQPPNNTEIKKPAKNSGVGAANSSAKESKNQNAQRKEAPKKRSKASKSKKPGICSVLCKYFLLTLVLLSGLGTMLYFVNNDVQEVVDIYIQHAKDADLGSLKGLLENFPSILTDESQEAVEEKKESYPIENDFVDDDEGELRGNLPPPVTETKTEAEEKPAEPAVAPEIKEPESKAPEIVETPVTEEAVPPVVEEPVVPEVEEPIAEASKSEEPEAPVAEEAPVVEEPEPVAEEPKPEEPVAEEPEAPVAEEPKPEEPVAEEPEAPVAEEPKPEEPVAEEPEAPVAEEPKLSEPITKEPEAAVAEEPKPEEPVATEPKPEEPVAEEPEAPVAEEPRVDEPVAEEPEAPVAEEPRVDEPVAEEPEAPVVEEPRVDESVAEEPEAPVVEEPRVDESVAEEPEAPVAEEPRVEEPVAEEAEAPVAEEPRAEEPVAEEPEAPVAEEPRVGEPVAEEPRAEEPVAEEPRAEEPVAEEPRAEEPVAEEPRAEEPQIEEPETVAEEPMTEEETPENYDYPTEREAEEPEVPENTESETKEVEDQIPENAIPNVPPPEETAPEPQEEAPVETAESTSTNDDNDLYEKDSITNSNDYQIRDQLDDADQLLEEGFPRDALESFNNLLSKNLKSPRATYGRAAALSDIAKIESSNQILEQSMHVLEVLISNPETPDALLLKGGLDLAKKQLFRGWTKRALKTLTFLDLRFPNDAAVQNELGVTHLLLGRNEEAKTTFQDVLKNHPGNGFAMVHLGFIIKTHDNNPAKAIPYLQVGIATGESGVLDARFYFHLGDAYQRVGLNKQAKRVYEDGAAKKLFLSRDQRSLYNVDRLTGKPWWDPEELSYKTSLEVLEENWETIRDEALSLMSSTDAFVDETEKLREKGVWKQLTLYQRGIKARNGCEYAPRTCAILQTLPDTINCKRGQVKFSLMQPGTHVWPHCGPTNCRIRAHLGLLVPAGARIKVGNHTREWKEGKFIIFDDSFEHEVWHQGNKSRVVLIVDLWHPELTAAEKATLPPI